MVNKNILILTGALVAGAAVAVLAGRDDREADPRVGKALLEPTAAAGIDHIDIKKSGASATLVRDADGVWHLGDPAGFPVDATRVVRLMDELARVRLQAVVATGEKSLEDLGLGASATPVTLAMTSGGKAALALALGNDRKGGGQYVALGGDKKGYLATQAVAVSPDDDAWEMKTLLDVDKAAVKSVAFDPAPGAGRKASTVARAKKEEPLKEDGILSAVTFSKRHPADYEMAKAAFTAPSRATVTLFDGRTYDVAVGSIGDKTKTYFLKIKGDAKKDAALNRLMETYAFEVPAFVAQRFEDPARS